MDHPQGSAECSSAAPQYSEGVGSMPVNISDTEGAGSLQPVNDISDTLLRETAEAVSEASRALTSTLSCIQSFFSIDAAPDVKFRKMRQHVTECILVYRDLNLPLFSTVVTDLKTIVSLYEGMDEETFTTYIAEIAKEVSERAENAKKARKNDMRMVEQLNCQKEEAIKIIESLTLAHSEGLKAKRLLQQGVVSTEREPLQSEPQKGLGLNKLTNVEPVRSPHHSKEPADVEVQQPDKVRLAIYFEAEALMALSAAQSIRDTLLPALQVFTASVQKVTKFFLTLEKEVCSFASQSVGTSQTNLPESMSLHYAIMVKNSGSIIQSCNEYISAAPTVRAKIGDLSTVLRQEDQDNYIQKWINETQTQQVERTSDHPLQVLLEHTSTLQTQEHEPSEATLMSEPQHEQSYQHPHVEEPQQKSPLPSRSFEEFKEQPGSDQLEARESTEFEMP
ncbi:hypothetical protein M758_2G166000 [Ceratodon purpureus]|nr:hypothetical protein M758_2G166000 [Ceratodon purpureus]